MTIDASSVYEQLRQHLSALKLQATLDALPQVMDQAATQDLTLTQTLEKLFAIERSAQEARQLAGRFRFANIPSGLTLDGFDVDYASGIDEVFSASWKPADLSTPPPMSCSWARQERVKPISLQALVTRASRPGTGSTSPPLLTWRPGVTGPRSRGNGQQ